MRKAVTLFILSALLLHACSVRVPYHLPDEEEMEALLYDYHLAQAMAEAGSDSVDYKRYSYVNAALKKHKMTEEEFDSAMVWYSKNAGKLKDIYKRLDARFQEQSTGVRAAYGHDDAPHIATDGDMEDIWHDYDFKVLSTAYACNEYSFSIDADTSFYRGDELTWRIDARYVTKGRRGDAYACMYVRYDNDSSSVTSKRLYSNGKIELRCLADSLYRITSVGGFVYFKKHEEDVSLSMLLLQNIRLTRLHHGKPDMLMTDSIAPDSLTVETGREDTLVTVNADTLDTLSADSTLLPVDSTHRMSPTELRDSKPVERTINVVKERPYRVIRRKK